jgi:lipopolysaccharide/colanic/teichoic acid biosynthesis glycosyltransferase
VAVLVRTKLGSPVLFHQVRIGRGERPFRIAKFRTMHAGPGTDTERLTSFGLTLRRTSLDELPTLFNVVRGDMSLVGPRPLLPEYLPRYSAQQARRHEVRPGITGWAQVNGRNALTWEDKLALDVWYVDHRSVWLDLKILFRTVALVVAGHGISAPGSVTAEPFRGTDAGGATARGRGGR